jgi:hypothetical protein
MIPPLLGSSLNNLLATTLPLPITASLSISRCLDISHLITLIAASDMELHFPVKLLKSINECFTTELARIGNVPAQIKLEVWVDLRTTIEPNGGAGGQGYDPERAAVYAGAFRGEEEKTVTTEQNKTVPSDRIKDIVGSSGDGEGETAVGHARYWQCCRCTVRNLNEILWCVGCGHYSANCEECVLIGRGLVLNIFLGLLG